MMLRFALGIAAGLLLVYGGIATAYAALAGQGSESVRNLWLHANETPNKYSPITSFFGTLAKITTYPCVAHTTGRRDVLEKLLDKLDEPVPFRFLALRWLDRRIDFLNYRRKLNYGVLERPHFGHCLLQAATLACKLGLDRISAIEFGVAGGNGLVALEQHAEIVRRETGIEIAIFGFDTGTGMPPPQDHRDLPYMWQEGYFAMDVERLRSRLTRAEVILGPVSETIRSFCADRNPPPIGFISFDLDYYSSTVGALRLFDEDHRYFLPRVACYFDDMVGDIDWGYNAFTGELLAVQEFNERSQQRKLAQVNGLRHFGSRIPRVWHEQIFLAHLFDHPEYRRPISGLTQHPLQEPVPARPEASGMRPPGRQPHAA